MLAVTAAVVVAAASLRNGFAYDDVPLVVENARVTTLLPPWEYLGLPYWPNGGLYRPLTVSFMALLWKLGGGAPWIFHAANVALHALATGLVYLLARRLMAPWATFAALLFAVHPVHVEAVANAVGLSELLCTTLVLAPSCRHCAGTDGFTRRLAWRDRVRHARRDQQGTGICHSRAAPRRGIRGGNTGREARRGRWCRSPW